MRRWQTFSHFALSELVCTKNPLTEQLLGKLKKSQQKLLDTAQIINPDIVHGQTEEKLKTTYTNAVKASKPDTKKPLVHYSLHPYSWNTTEKK